MLCGSSSYHVTTFIALMVVLLHVLKPDLPGLTSKWLRPLILCGQRSLSVFCFGVLLSFAAYWILVQVAGGIVAQMLVSVLGIVLLVVPQPSDLVWDRNACNPDRKGYSDGRRRVDPGTDGQSVAIMAQRLRERSLKLRLEGSSATQLGRASSGLGSTGYWRSLAVRTGRQTGAAPTNS
jgi:hypothetical protein